MFETTMDVLKSIIDCILREIMCMVAMQYSMKQKRKLKLIEFDFKLDGKKTIVVIQPMTSAIPVHRYSRGHRVRISYKPDFLFRLSFHNCKSCVYNCDDLLPV